MINHVFISSSAVQIYDLSYIHLHVSSYVVLFVFVQGKGTCKTYWLISAVKRPVCKVNKHLHPNGQPLINYLNAPGHNFGSNSSLNVKRADSLRRSIKGNSPSPTKKLWHKTDGESAALLNQTTVWWIFVDIALRRFAISLHVVLSIGYRQRRGNARIIAEIPEMFRYISEVVEVPRKCSS